MKWDIHIENSSSKLGKSYNVMQPLEGITSVNILRSTYFTNFHSHLSTASFFERVMGK
jgi:hypothetical protein